MSAPQPLSADRLESLLQQRGEMSARARPTPREVFAKWLDNLGVGVGVGVVLAVLLWLLHAPNGVLIGVPTALGFAAFGALMIWRGSLDEFNDWRNQRAVRRTVSGLRTQYEAQTRTLRGQLEAAFDEIEELERALRQVGHERDLALLDLGREREMAAQNTRRTFVPAEAPEPQDAADAREMVRHYFDTGTHLSRRKAAEARRWPAERHAAAQSLLVRGGVLAVNATQPVMLAQTLDEALGKLNAYLVHARSLQAPSATRNNSYVEEE